MILRWGTLGAAALALAACNNQPADPAPEPTPSETGTPTDTPTEGASIIRADADIERVEAPLEPLSARISFDDGGSDLSETALAELQSILESRQLEAGGAITLRGHTDSEGSDRANLRASQNRAEAVRDWLVENRVSEERITVIAMGEQNPAKPNAKPDGSPDEEARAFNRRVDLTIAVPKELGALPDEPTLVEQVSSASD